jgi:hypothetical protein
MNSGDRRGEIGATPNDALAQETMNGRRMFGDGREANIDDSGGEIPEWIKEADGLSVDVSVTGSGL